MRLHKDYGNIERSGVGAESSFTMKTTAKAFDILSSGLYSDKILAIVRELSCNAYDSHVDAGKKNTPFEIHLPSALEPWFSVIDHGLGLHEDDILGKPHPVFETDDNDIRSPVLDEEGNQTYKRVGGLYTTYFDSTKTDSNDFIGALGLGSKSPFSYTDSFQVISRYNGKKMTFAVFLNEEGIPSVAKMGETDTDESNGLEVKIPVQKDFSTFERKTAKALQFFPVKPIVLGNKHFTFPKMPEAVQKGKDWIISPKYSGNPSLYAIQGNVCYPINRDMVNFNKYVLSSVNGKDIYIWFDIGELEVAASRENLQYDQRTKDNIENKISDISKQLIKHVDDQVKQHSTCYWNTVLTIRDEWSTLFKITVSDGRFWNCSRSNNMIKQTPKTPFKQFLTSTQISTPAIRQLQKQQGFIEVPAHKYEILNKYVNIALYTRTTSSRRGWTPAVRLKKAPFELSFVPTTHDVIIACDTNKAPIKRLTNWVNSNDKNAVVTFIRKNKDTTDKEFEMCVNRISKLFGNAPVKYLSDITAEPNKQPVSKQTLPFYTYNGFKFNSRGVEVINWKREEFQKDIGGAYIQLEYGTTPINDSGKVVSVLNLSALSREIMSFLSTILENRGLRLYGVTKMSYKQIKDNPKWVSAIDILNEEVLKRKDIISHTIRMRKTQMEGMDRVGIVDLIKKGQDSERKFLDKISNLPKGSLFKREVERINRCHNNVMKQHSDLIGNHTLLEAMDYHATRMELFDTDKRPYDLSAIIKRYPMLGVNNINMIRHKCGDSAVLDYIEMVDKSKLGDSK